MTVSLRKLAPDEAQRVFPRRGHQDLSEYVAALRDLHPGDAAGIDRTGVSDRALKRRLSLAAKQLSYRLQWGRQADAGILYVQVVATPHEGQQRPSTTLSSGTHPCTDDDTRP